MTVRRTERESFDLEREKLAEFVRETLREDGAYRDVEELDGGDSFTAIHQAELLVRRNGHQNFAGKRFAQADIYGGHDRTISCP